MRPTVLDLVACPTCGGQLELRADELREDEVVYGELICRSCAHCYPIKNRLPYLYVEDAFWTPKAREAQGWVDYHKKLGIYEQPPDAIDLQIPYYTEGPWPAVARHFDAGLRRADLRGDEVVLDLGAGRGWAAKQFALRGCRVAAIDVVADEQVGIGRAYELMQQAQVTFDPVVGDSERLPFRSEAFDVVFAAAVLHHTSDLPALLQSVHRVLKPGGRLLAVNEPCISVGESPQRVLQRDAAEELAFGINESRPNYADYWSALNAAGFYEIEIQPLDAIGLDEGALRRWGMSLGAIAKPLRYWQLRKLPQIVKGYLWRWRNTWKMRGRLSRPCSEREALLQTILVHVSSGVVIHAHRAQMNDEF